ncbi:MAG TPA: prenyltransferase/squalene oxidase repeat-containing protein [Phycisphaerae bacterium]|nr:prenyltransferase/squalene oxidase repeat-containing protein [Phycisphaerae bacterium]
MTTHDAMTSNRNVSLTLRLAAGLLAAACVAAWPGAARADEASPTLAPYKGKLDGSIDRALAYIAKHQLKDGSFQADMAGSTGITSLCAMAFLAKGYTPGTGPYGEVINRGVDFVLATQKSNGMLIGRTASHGPMYSHTIATLMLSEVSGMVDPVRQKKVDEALGQALRLTLAAQKVQKNRIHEGGWRYQHNSPDSDISCTGWALMSLRSARNNGAAVPKEAIDRAIQFVMNCRCSDGGFGYTGPAQPGLARTGTALLCLELCGRHRDKAAIDAGEWVLNNLPTHFGGGQFYYGLYYCAQGMFQLGGHYWERWAKNMYDMMLKYQRPDGSWPRGTSSEGPAGECYSTAMGVLAMSVSYRQLPIYQR